MYQRRDAPSAVFVLTEPIRPSVTVAAAAAAAGNPAATSLTPEHPAATANHAFSIGADGETSLLDAAMQLFIEFDTNDSQHLDHVQFANVLAEVGRRFGIPPPTLPQIAGTLAASDINGDGLVGLHEFVAWYKANFWQFHR